MAINSETLAQRLARYVVDLDYRALPEEVVRNAKELLLDQLCCQLIGSTLSWNKIIYDYVVSYQGLGESTIVNYGTRTSALDAAFTNGTFGQGSELDDYLDNGAGHPGAATVPVAMALAEKERIDGKTLLTAVVAGYDIGYHLGAAAIPNLSLRGFHPQSVLGVFAAAATASKALGLNTTQVTHAFAIAGSHASGTMEYDQSGGEVKRMHNGLAVRGGIQSAILAKMGLTGPPTIFEGKRGILPLFAGESFPERVIQGLGKEYGVMHAGIKPYPTMAGLHSSIGALDALIQEHGIRAEQVQSIEVGLSEVQLHHGATIYEPHDTLGAQFSLAFSLAIRLLKGSNDLSLYTDPTLWRDPKVLALARKVHPYHDPKSQGRLRLSSKMRVVLVDGKTLERYEPYPKGTPLNPLTHQERLAKCREMASTVLPVERAGETIGVVEQIESLKDVSRLAALLVR